MKTFVFLISILICPSLLFAQEYRIYFDQVSLQQGLSSDLALDIAQDKKGFMWFATYDGLNKYDGYRVATYKHRQEDSTSIAANYLRVIKIDRSGIIWIGMYGSGLDRFDPETETFTHYTYDSENENSLGHDYNIIWDLFLDKEDKLWIVSFGGGLDRFDPETETFTHYKHDPADSTSIGDNFIRVVTQDQNGFLWIGSANSGLNRLDPKTDRFVHFRHNPKDPKSISNDAILAIHEDQGGRLWIGTDTGLDLFDARTESFIHYAMIDENIRVLYSVEPGLLWAGTLGGGLIRIEIEEQGHGSPPKLIPVSYQHDPEKPQTLCHNDVVDIFEDRSGVLWIATFGGGLSKFSLKSERFRHYRRVGYSGNQSAIRSVYEDRSGTLWIGVDGGGLLAYDRSGGSINSFQHDPNNATSLSHDVVSAIAEDESGNLWVGTRGGGLNRFDLTQNRFFHYQHDEQDSASLSSDLVHAVVADDQGALWIGTDGGGLNRFDPKTERFESFRHDPDDPASLVHSSIQCVCRTRDRMLWIGTWKGLSRLDPINRKFVNYRHDPEARASLPHPTILSIYEDRSGMIWLASHGGGVIRFDPKKEEFQQFTEHDGLANNVVYGVLGDEYDNIWLCTKNGLSKLNTKSETFRNYYKKDGLVSNLFYWGAYHKGREGELFVGGMEGLNSFFPLPQNTNKPTVAVTGFRIFDQDAAYKGQNIELSYKENFISFEFAVLDYQDPSRNQFSCKLEGLNEDWIYCGTRNYINYTNLDGGDYVFRVKGGNIDGNWNDMHAAIHVRVIPPVWKRKWFYVLEIILVIAAAMGVTLYIRRRIRYEMDFQRKTNELNYARELQIAMLPRSDVNLPKMEIMGKMITASEVGGDYYDFIPLDDHRYCVALGDATGHGVAAGLVVGMIKMALNTSVQKVGSSSTIEELVLSLNSALLESISQNYMGMSFSIAIIDQKNLHVQISSTGMPYPYYYQADTKKMIPIELNGPPLGILEDITVQTHNFHAELGDMLVLLSDGFVERFDEKGEMWGFDALEESLEAIFWEEKTAGRVMDSLIQACDKFANRQENDDDMTVVAIRFRE